MVSNPFGGSPGTASVKRHLPLLGLVTVAALLALALLLAQPGEAQTITVDDDGPADYDNLKDAIDNVTSGDTIFISEGYYDEDVVMRGYHLDNISIIGESQENVIIIYLKLSDNSNISINNLTLETIVIYSSNININNLFINYIRISFTSNISIHHSSIGSISISDDENILIDNISACKTIDLSSSKNITISNSEFLYNGSFQGGASITSYFGPGGGCKNCVINDNTFTRKKYTGQYSTAYAIRAERFINVSIVNNVFINYNISIFLESYSNINRISNNSFQHNGVGIKFVYSGNNIIDGNRFMDTDIAIWTDTEQKRIENNAYINVKDEYYFYVNPDDTFNITQSGFNTSLAVVTIFLVTTLIVRISRKNGKPRDSTRLRDRRDALPSRACEHSHARDGRRRR